MNYFDEIAYKIKNFKEHADIKKWKSFELDFSTRFENKVKVIESIKKEIPNYKSTTGFYSIFKDSKCLYIGIGRPIWSRLKSHYFESQPQSKIRKGKKWFNFFRKYQTNLTIYWLEYQGTENKKQGDKLRALIENILELEYKPEFEKSSSE